MLVMREYRRRRGAVATGAVREAATPILDLILIREAEGVFGLRVLAWLGESTAWIEHVSVPHRLLEATLAPYILLDAPSRERLLVAHGRAGGRILPSDSVGAG
jgi:hypothetical protein